jgi:hypothetical protein
LGESINIEVQNNKALGGFNIPLSIINFVFAVGMFIAGFCSFFLKVDLKLS